MVISLKTLANKKDEYVRAVLFSILRNTAEPYEVRVAAALNIFLAFPTSEMMQIMAHMTNDDPSVQVRGVIATSISFAANLKDPRFAQLAKTAQAVSSIVSKEKFGYRASADSIIDDYTSNDDLAHFRELSFIGSADSATPKYHRTALRLRGNGLTEEDWMSWSVSDVQNLIYSVLDLMVADQYIQPDLKYSAEKVAKELNIKREHDPIEGAFFIDNLNQQRLFTFGQKDLRSLLSEYFGKVSGLFSGNVNQFTKVIIAKQVVVTFPLAAGLPFVYVYSEPTLFNIDSVASRGKGSPFNFDVKFTYSRNLDGSVGFLDTFSGVYARSGVINKLQYFIPAKFIVTPTLYANVDLKFEIELPEKDANLIHMSVFPYTSLQKLYSALAVSEDPSTKVIKRSTTVLDTDINIGESAGVSLNLKGHSYSNDFKKNIFASDILTNVRNLLYQNDIACTHFDLKYVAKDTKNKKIASTVLFETLFEHEGDDELKPAGYLTDLIGNSVNRRKKLADQAASGIEYAKVRIADFSVVFDGENKKEFVLTSALATNPLDNNVQAIVYANGCVPINAVFKIVKPKTIPLNFEKALKNEIKVEYEVDFKYGNSENIVFKGIGERSKEYTERLSNDPLAKKCLQETSNKNFYQKDCHKMIIKAHAPDYFKGTVTYKDVNPVLLNATYKIYNIFKHFTTWEEDEDLMKATEDGKVEIEAQAFYYDNYINYKFNTKYGEFRMNNVEGRSYYPYAMAIYTPITHWERSYNWFTGYQHLPFCTVDDNKIWTFSGRSYDYSLTGSWHVAMVDESGENGNKLVILVKRPGDNQEEVYVSYTTKSGYYVEIQINSKTYEVTSNAKQVAENAVTTYFDEIFKVPLVEYYYSIEDDYQVYSLNNGAIRFIYDDHRLVIFSDDHRSTTRGLCGQSTSQPSDDYMTPYGLVDLPEHYGASFSLEDEESDPKTVELKKEAKVKAYQPVTEYTNILRSDDEWSKIKNESIKEL
ncbi:unnamed protein product [Spodoptera littoralis]|uniref:VWFD domain-containing protein n=1 Tax=Spodoptera littoralis TaxID=7109 RepID=A0A9P0IF24_SPOLI|nr:unnamed protein product [Spodoptera littoralis]CAH1643965.1 unnamed protein product [Spodoptera littoralis]